MKLRFLGLDETQTTNVVALIGTPDKISIQSNNHRLTAVTLLSSGNLDI